ncbi:MAG: hypothetical protein N2255_07920, partial [Kiritimatiellae bacterium]|nr:hypothetical protein [Kiritimatiellia bacterium]
DVYKRQTSHFTVKLVLNRKGRPSAVSDFVRKHLTGMLGKGVVVDVRFVDSIEPMAGDKHRTFVSLVTRR